LAKCVFQMDEKNPAVFPFLDSRGKSSQFGSVRIGHIRVGRRLTEKGSNEDDYLIGSVNRDRQQSVMRP